MDVTEKMDLSLLPELVLENVLYFMNGSNLIIANKVCRSWKELSSRALRDRVSSFILVPPYATKFLGSFIRDGTKALVFQEYDVDEKDLYDGSSSNKIRKRKSPESDSSEADLMRPFLKSDEILLDFIRNQMTSVPEICFIFAYGNDDADLTLSLSQLYHECGFSFSAVRVSCGFLFDSICEGYAPDCRSYSPYLDAESGINYAPRGGFSSLITSKHPSLYKTIMMDLGNPSRDESCFLDPNYPLKCLFIFKHGKQEEYGPIRENDLDRVSKELREYIYENGVEVVDFRSLHITYLDDQSSIIKRCENYLLVGFFGKSIQVAKSFLNQSDYTKQIDRGYQEIWIEWLECFRDCLDFNPDIYNCKTHTIGFIFAPCNLTGLIICAREIFPKVMFISAHAGSTLVKPFKNLNPDNFRDISEKVFYSTAVDREIAILLIHFTSGEQTLSSPTDESTK